MKACRVLIISAHRAEAQATADMLRLAGFNTLAAHISEDCGAAARAFRPHIALIEMDLPAKAEHRIAQRLRADLGLTVQLVALSPACGEPTKTHAYRLGYDHHLTTGTAADVLGLCRELRDELGRGMGNAAGRLNAS